MQIGELASRAGTTTRRLRYYEQQGLLAPDRADNNYRDYGDDAVEKAHQIRLLVESGMPTRLIRLLLPCLDGPDAQLPSGSSPELAEVLDAELTRLNQNIERLQLSRDQIQCYLDRVTGQSTSGCVKRDFHGSGSSETHLLRRVKRSG